MAQGKYSRREEVTRTVDLSRPGDTIYQRSATPSQKQVVGWAGPIEAIFGYAREDVEPIEDWWLDRIHPDDLERVLDSLTKHLAPAPDTPFAAQSRLWGPDYRWRHASGHYVLVSDRTFTTRDEQGNAVRYESMLFGKETRRIEREIHMNFLESQNQIALIANNTASGIFMMDPQGHPTYMNAAAERITGFRFDEILDFTFHASVHSCRPNGDPYPLVECPVFGHQQAGIAAKSLPEIFVHKSGRFYDIEYSVAPVGDYSQGSIIEFRDVTEEKNMQRERMNVLLENEQQSIRIKESETHKVNMTSFVSFVCHELRNPLQGVTSSAEFLLDTLQQLEAVSNKLLPLTSQCHTETPLNSLAHRSKSIPNGSNGDRKGMKGLTTRNESPTLIATETLLGIQSLITNAIQLVGNIQTCAEHQALITNNVLDLSRLDAGKVEPAYDVVDVRTLAHQTVAMMLARAQRKFITLSVEHADRTPLFLMADATLLSQVLLNLVSNAIKFTPEHGRITIDLTVDSPTRNNQVVLHFSVMDNGLGMSEAEQERLFQRFSQANKRVAQLYGGSGLGLSISKELVRVLGGKMHVESAPGKGSTFSFTSVHEQPTASELAQFFQNSNLAAPGRKTSMEPGTGLPTPAPKFRLIGVAEDNPINLKLLAKHLQALGYDTILCTDGQQMVDSFCKSDGTFDAIIMDMSMPNLDGPDAARLIRKFEADRSALRITPRVPIIALSGNALKEQITNAMTAGLSDYLIKPCKQAELGRTLEYWENIVHTGSPHKPIADRLRRAS